MPLKCKLYYELYITFIFQLLIIIGILKFWYTSLKKNAKKLRFLKLFSTHRIREELSGCRTRRIHNHLNPHHKIGWLSLYGSGIPIVFNIELKIVNIGERNRSRR